MLSARSRPIHLLPLASLLLIGCQRPGPDIEEINEEIVREALAAIDDLNFDHLRELLADDFVVRFVGYPDRIGRDTTFDLIRGTYASFPDQAHVIEEMITEGGRVVVRLRYEGTHQGEFEGIAPTGKEFDYVGVQIYSVTDGVIRDVWILDDSLALMSQLGMELAPVEAGQE